MQKTGCRDWWLQLRLKNRCKPRPECLFFCFVITRRLGLFSYSFYTWVKMTIAECKPPECWSSSVWYRSCSSCLIIHKRPQLRSGAKCEGKEISVVGHFGRRTCLLSRVLLKANVHNLHLSLSELLCWRTFYLFWKCSISNPLFL